MKFTANASTIKVEVAYAAPGNQFLFELAVPEGATVATVLEACSSGALLPATALRSPDIGIFGRPVALTHVLRSGDRVEFYRPLVADPKDSRRRRASSSRRNRRTVGSN